MITLDMLKYPDFCLAFYETTKMYVEKSVCSIANDFLAQILRSLDLGLNSFGMKIQSVCLEIINLLATNAFYDQNSESFLYSGLMPFLKLIFEMILTNDLDSNNRIECCRAMFTLMCVYRERYGQIVDSVLHGQPDLGLRERLAKEIGELVSVDEMHNNRTSHFLFKNRFDKFIANVAFMNTN